MAQLAFLWTGNGPTKLPTAFCVSSAIQDSGSGWAAPGDSVRKSYSTQRRMPAWWRRSYLVNKPRTNFVLPVDPYPLQRTFALWGLVVGAVGAALFRSPLAGLAFFVLFLNTGLLWRRNEAPILPFCLAYQWLFAVLGYLFFCGSVKYPSGEKIGNLEGAVALSLVGLSVLAVGLRFGLYCWDKSDLRRNKAVLAGEPRYDVRRLFFVTLAGALTAFMWRRAPIDVWFGGAQILYRLLELRTILLALLLFCVLRQRKGYGYGLVAAAMAWVSSFGSVMSSF